MKKFTLIAAMAVVAASASAQYTCDPTTKTVIDAGKVASVQYINLDAASVAAFQAQGAACESIGPDDVNKFLYIWDGTFVGGDGSLPGVGDHFDGYASLTVGNVGWSGAGYFISAAANANTTSWTDETHFHIAYMSPGTVCPSIALIIGNQDGTNTPAKVSLGTAFNDNGKVFPAIAPAATDDWQGVDITFAQLKKIYPTFNFANTAAWQGNILSFLAGGVAGQTLAFDAIYFYTPATDGIHAIENANNWVVTRNTVNVPGATHIEVYDLTGRLVKAANASTVGISNLPAGIYVARSGNVARKIVK